MTFANDNVGLPTPFYLTSSFASPNSMSNCARYRAHRPRLPAKVASYLLRSSALCTHEDGGHSFGVSLHKIPTPDGESEGTSDSSLKFTSLEMMFSWRLCRRLTLCQPNLCLSYTTYTFEADAQIEVEQPGYSKRYHTAR